MLSNALIKSLNAKSTLYNHNLKILDDGLLISGNTLFQGDISCMTSFNVNDIIVNNTSILSKVSANSLNVTNNVNISGNTNIYGNLNIAGAINIITTNSKLLTYDHILITTGSNLETALEINKNGDTCIFKAIDNDKGKLFEIDNNGNIYVGGNLNIDGKLNLINPTYSFLEAAGVPMLTSPLIDREHSYMYWDILTDKVKNNNLLENSEITHMFKVNKTGIYSINATFNYVLSSSSTRATITSFISRNAGQTNSQEITNPDIGFNLLNSSTDILSILVNNINIANTIYLKKNDYISLGSYVHTTKNGTISLGHQSRLQFTYLF